MSELGAQETDRAAIAVAALDRLLWIVALGSRMVVFRRSLQALSLALVGTVSLL